MDVSSIRTSFLTKIKQHLASFDDPEVEQALKIRLFIGFVIVIYFCLPWYESDTLLVNFFATDSLIALGYFFGASLIAAAIIAHPHSSPKRRIAGIILDLTSLSLLTAFSGGESNFMFVFYLWVILGNGFRYGISYLYFSMVIGALGFGSVLIWSDFWQDPHYKAVGISLLLILLIVPAYSAFLINKLHAAIASAKEANEAKSRFLANMSHELRTPLNGVIGMADLLEKTEISRQQYEFIDIMKSSANSLLGLIENVLDISKIEAGKVVIHEEKFDLYELVTSIIRMQGPMGKVKSLDVSCHIDPATPFMLMGDQQHLRQILINLIGNAIKFTHEGWVKVSVFPVDNDDENSLVRFEIEDSGIGLTYDEIEIIFDDFTQVNASNNDIEGTGLGTTISKELVELLGGEIGIESKKGEGSTFWVELPFTRLLDENLPLTDKKILLLTSDETAQKLLPSLNTWGLHHDLATSTARAFSLLISAIEENSEYQVLLVEQSCIGDIEPIKFAEMIRAEASLEHLALVLINSKRRTKYDPRLNQLYISELHDLDNKHLLFNAIHAAQSINIDDDKVVNLASHIIRAERRSLNILIAEDNRVNQQVIMGVLEHAGHRPTIVSSGEQVLDVLTDNPNSIDLLILDMNLPELTGVEVLQALPFMGVDSIPVIMLTADATPEAKERCLSSGADVFMTKPLDSSQLLEHIAVLSPPKKMKDKAVESVENNEWCDHSVIAELAVLGGGNMFVSQLVKGFKEDGNKHLAIIKLAAVDDYLRFRESVHALKGSSAELGAKKLVELCLQAEGLKPYDTNGRAMLLLTEKVEEAFLKTLSALEESLLSDLASHQPTN